MNFLNFPDSSKCVVRKHVVVSVIEFTGNGYLVLLEE